MIGRPRRAPWHDAQAAGNAGAYSSTRRGEDRRFDCVNVDLYKISRKVIDYFIGRGYQRIGFYRLGATIRRASTSASRPVRQWPAAKRGASAGHLPRRFQQPVGATGAPKAMLQSKNGYPPALLVATDSIAIGAAYAARTRHSGAGADRADRRQRHSTTARFISPPCHGAHPFRKPWAHRPSTCWRERLRDMSAHHCRSFVPSSLQLRGPPPSLTGSASAGSVALAPKINVMIKGI